jgi:hypothetical protein
MSEHGKHHTYARNSAALPCGAGGRGITGGFSSETGKSSAALHARTSSIKVTSPIVLQNIEICERFSIL